MFYNLSEQHVYNKYIEKFGIFNDSKDDNYGLHQITMYAFFVNLKNINRELFCLCICSHE